MDDSTSLIYSDWITFEHSVSNISISSSESYDYNIKDANGNENYEVGHNFIQIQANETFYSDNSAVLGLYSVTLPDNYQGFIYDYHDGAQNTQKSGNLESFSIYLKNQYILMVGNTIYSGLTICRMRIWSIYNSSPHCNATVTGKYRYIDFKT